MQDDMRFCESCGAENDGSVNPNMKTASAKSKKKALLAAMIAVVAIAAAAMIVVQIIIHRRGSDSDEKTTTAAETSVGGVREEDRKRAFADYFEETKSKNQFYEFPDAFVVDLDGDEIPEVIGGWCGWSPSIAYYDAGEIKEVYIPEDNIAHSTIFAGDFPNTLYYDARQHIVIYRCEGRNHGTAYHRVAVAYKYSKGALTELKSVKPDRSPEDFEDVYSEESYAETYERFEEQFAEFTQEWDLTAFGDVAVYEDDLFPYLSECFGFVP